ncbi:1,4-dihydroxy-2-naphthoate octaprenyltransferase [candidate division KSB1 bacterium]|nr:1,4-dihydroxy-2-naphthoate octaprenyltransferase [candidate division KSB1 bacterium]
MGSKVKIWIREIRAPFFTGTIVPIVLGTIVAYNQTGSISWFYFALTLIGGLALHAGANVSNDYFDHLSDDDEINNEFAAPFTGGSRVIQDGLLTPREVLIGSIVSYLIAAIVGGYLFIKLGPVILILGVIGAVSGFFYTAPPFYFVSRGIGEVIIALNFGVLMTFGAFFVQAHVFAWEPIIASLPVAFLIAAVLYINEFQDYSADREVGKNHLVVRMGKEKASRGYMIIMMLTYLSLVLGVVTDVLPPFALAGLLTLPLAFRAVRVTFQHFNDSPELVPANVSTIMNHLFTGLLISIGYVLDKFI